MVVQYGNLLLSADSGMYFAIRYFYKGGRSQKSVLMGQKGNSNHTKLSYVMDFFLLLMNLQMALHMEYGQSL